METALLSECEAVLAGQQLACLDLQVGSVVPKTVRVIVPRRYIHLLLAGENQFGRVVKDVDVPTYYVVFFFDDAFEANQGKPLSQKDITIRLAFLPDGRMVKIVRNSNYFGELKKGVFAAEDYAAKTQHGGIFLHAGCRSDFLQQAHGPYRQVVTLLAALSANGKTSTTCRVLANKRDEESWLVQDDGGTLMPDGSFYGFEQGGIFVKTEDLNPHSQVETYYGALRPDTIFENVMLRPDGRLDFYSAQKTSNGRAIIPRRDFMHTSQSIKVDHVDNLVLITRGPTIPAICRLTKAQAAAYMCLGQAMQSSAGDPSRAGKLITEFFYDPFAVGSHAEHANIFYRIISGIPGLRCFLINTGGIGEGDRYRDIGLNDTMGILDSLLRGGLEDWELNQAVGLEVPLAIRTVDSALLHPEECYVPAEFAQRQQALNQLRAETIAGIGPDLDPEIASVFLLD
ncbi:MAG: phosphoenolpyruvate carboxykinase (ATP) [Candidatus Buchananbacteria bacterium]